MLKNFALGIVAIAKDIGLFFSSLFGNTGVMNFFGGFLVAIILSGFVLTKDPRHIPLVLRYSSFESFQKIAKRDEKGTYKMAFTDFVKFYNRTRIVFFLAAGSFAVMVVAIVFIYGRS